MNVIPAKAGIQKSLVVTAYSARDHWIPAFAGMTRESFSGYPNQTGSSPKTIRRVFLKTSFRYHGRHSRESGNPEKPCGYCIFGA
jgi:hypothetical protein